jgi:hypothetical protein
VTNERSVSVPFQAHVGLLHTFLAHRDLIVEGIQSILNAQQKPVQHLQDRSQLLRLFEDCFFFHSWVTREQAALRGRLQEAHWASGFKPRDMPGIPNDMFDPADMMTRAFNQWRHTRWPGRNGRVRFAQTLFNLYIVRCLTLLDMRLWDGPDAASDRITQLQALLDQLWKSSPSDQPVLVRDARWLVPVAQSPTTDELGPYFEIAGKIAGSLAEDDRVEIHKATVVMAGGHLRSQLRHFNMQGTPLDDHGLLLNTRRSNALDCAMTMQALVSLLDAYVRAIDQGDERSRIDLADAICQGISPDPDLFVNRLDLLGAYSMIEHLFVTTDSDGSAVYTPLGQRHLALVQRYSTLLDRIAPNLAVDCARFRPVAGSYSPYGVMYGFSSNLLEHMTVKSLQPDAETRFSLEDVFVGLAAGPERLAWVSGWRKLPHISQEVQQMYQYPAQFAQYMFDRVEQALRQRASGDSAACPGRLFVVAEDDAGAKEAAASIAELPVGCRLSSDPGMVAANKAQSVEESRLLLDRNEGEFLVSYQTPGGWTAISKDILTDVLGAGRDARVELPRSTAEVLKLMCPDLIGLT